MSEQVVASAMAEVMVYDEGVKTWVPVSAAMGVSNLSQVELVHNQRMNTFRIVATRLHDRSPVLNCKLFHRLKYVCPRSTFHQWRDELRKVHGLSFSDHDQATAFSSVVYEALGVVSQLHNAPNGDHYSYNDSASNGVYQEPTVNHLHHNANSAPVFRDADQDSICSNGQQHLPNYRKSSHSIHSASGAGNAVSLAAATPGGSVSSSSLMNTVSSVQRRASQGSTTSSSNSSATNVQQNGNGVYASSNGAANHASSPCRAAPPPAPPLPPGVVNGGPPAPPGPPPVLSSNAPPAPPPLPPNLLKGSPKAQTLADQLKNRPQLRKVSTSSNSDVGSKAELAPKPIGGGGFLNELSAKLTLRKTAAAAEGSASTSSSEATPLERKPSAAAESSSSSSNGVVKSWMKSNGSVPLDSPKSHRKAPSGSSLSSQEEPLRTGVGANVPAVDIQQLKQEIMAEVRNEIRASEQRIIDAILAELRRH
ncbi:hypothetical protein QR680_005926 [Steinernema hermaphroditum]|uniref:WH1 domain-containing protein n=1 Tax=Steinernema hermaphroditum TaxID=289476 RepID=A0AA39HUV7_9BILA|nr:hypothetical protein QR680_005926 [Steinernema hermaphroditum]